MWSEKNTWQWKQDQWDAIRLALKEEEGGPWAKQDLDKGLELISKAIEIDNKCDFAYETMGTIEVQR